MTSLMYYTDGYKLDHRRQYPLGTEYVYSNLTARAGRDTESKGVVFAGVQPFLDRYFGEMADKFFAAPRDVVAAEYEEFLGNYIGPNDIGVEHILALHDLGYIPLEICCVPEGTFVPYGVPCMTIENTLPEFFWLTNYFETLISSEMWMICTSATMAKRYREILDYCAEKTAEVPEFVDFQAHDFSFRGMPGVGAAKISGAGHLFSFTGSDNLAAIKFVEKYYGATGFVAGGVPATEHSVMCAGGADNELETYSRLLDVYPTGIVSIVSDTWDLWEVCTRILPELKDKIMARDGKVVIRPDSGDPANILCGDPNAEPGSPAFKGVIQLLDEVFGSTVNSKGYKELDSHIGAIYGDSITLDRCADICIRLKQMGYASTNVVFGVGSFTYQYVTRDTHSFAIKSTWAQINGEEHKLFKDPATDSGVKKSKTGRMVVLRIDGELTVVDNLSKHQQASILSNMLKPVWRDSKFLYRTTLEDIRARVQSA